MIYGILSTIAFVLILPFWLILGLFKPKLIHGFKEKCGFYKNLAHCGKGRCDNSKTVIFYGVSVGEVLAMENLIKQARETFPDLDIVLLTGTKTGQEIAHKKLGETCDFISYFPFDFPFCIDNMLKKLRPNAIFVMETELWPNFAYIVNKKKIPLFIINARISDRTYKSYKKLSFLFGPILRKYTAIYPQSKQDMDKLISIGANQGTTTVMGNLKFDIKKPDISSLDFEKNLNHPHKILIAGSTHPGEDEIILNIFL
jgi:3-deoxy-D-manno-octulosonic-acid transferase